MMAAQIPMQAEFVCTSAPGEVTPYVARLRLQGDDGRIDGMDDESVARGLTVTRRKGAARLVAITGHEREFAVWGDLRPAGKARHYRLSWHLRPSAPGQAEIWSRARCVRIGQGTAA